MLAISVLKCNEKKVIVSIIIIKIRIPGVNLALNKKHFITKDQNRDMSSSSMERINVIEIKFF